MDGKGRRGSQVARAQDPLYSNLRAIVDPVRHHLVKIINEGGLPAVRYCPSEHAAYLSVLCSKFNTPPDDDDPREGIAESEPRMQALRRRAWTMRTASW